MWAMNDIAKSSLRRTKKDYTALGAVVRHFVERRPFFPQSPQSKGRG